MTCDVRTSVSGAPPPARVRRLLARTAKALTASRVPGPTFAEVSVFFCGDERIRALNRRYRGKDRPTDVLAFPAEGRLLGDIVISVPYAGRQARRSGEPRSRELDRLLLHGYLHLLGYDHETDGGRMDALETRLRRRLGLQGRRA